MSGYVPGYLVPFNQDTSPWFSINTNQEMSVTTINGVGVLIPNGLIGTAPYSSSGSTTSGIYAGRFWVPGDVSNIGGRNWTIIEENNTIRDTIAGAYEFHFRRRAGPVAMENWVWTWRYDGGAAKYGTIYEMVRQGGVASGELNLVATKPYDIPYTYYPPEYGCTNSTALNYRGPAAPLRQFLTTTNPVIISNNNSCTYISATLSASPTEILSGNSSTLIWSTSNSTSATISNIGNVALSGSQTVSPTSTTNYTLTARNSSNLTASATATATITVRNRPTGSISLSPSSIENGNSSTLTWSTSNATSVSIDNGIGAVQSSGSITVNPTVTTTYNLTVNGYFNTSFTTSATLSVSPPIAPYINDNGIWKRARQIYIKDSGVWKQCISAYVNINGTWTQMFK